MNLETKQPIQPDTIMRIYSMTKPITSVAVLMLYEEGHFQLDDPVARFIPELAEMKVCREVTADGLQLVEQEQAVTIRDLLLHMSGLPYDSPAGSPVEVLYHQAELTSSDRTLQAMVQALGKLPLASQRGSVWRYSLSTDVLGYLVEVIAGIPFDAFLEQRIFKPLGMPDTGFYVPLEKHERLASVYWPGLGRVDTPEVNHYTQPHQFLAGGAGLVSTVLDYLRFAQMLLNGGELDGIRLLGRKTVELMTVNHLPSHCLPFRLGPPEVDHLTLGHGFGLGVRVLLDATQVGFLGSEGEFGWSGAANTAFWVDPKEEMICLFMTQFMPAFVIYPVERQFKVLAYQAIVD